MTSSLTSRLRKLRRSNRDRADDQRDDVRRPAPRVSNDRSGAEARWDAFSRTDWVSVVSGPSRFSLADAEFLFGVRADSHGTMHHEGFAAFNVVRNPELFVEVLARLETRAE